MDSVPHLGLLAPLFFPVIWLAACASVSLFGGWWSLARDFRADERTDGERFRFASGSLGRSYIPVNYSNCLFIAVDDRGIGLAVLILFRFCNPPLFIPWSMVDSVVSKRFLFSSYCQIRIRDHWPIISLYGGAGRHILEVYARKQAAPTRSARLQYTDRPQR
jgi:hypothetical protein